MTADDLLVGIFCYLRQNSDIKKLTADREILHKAFYAVKVKFPDKMTTFTFREREQFPESAQLDQALSNLDATGLISRQNLTPRYYLFEDPLVSTYDTFSKKILASSGISEDDLKAFAGEIRDIAYGTA